MLNPLAGRPKKPFDYPQNWSGSRYQDMKSEGRMTTASPRPPRVPATATRDEKIDGRITARSGTIASMNCAVMAVASLGRATEFRGAFGFGRLRLCFGFDRLDPGALDPRRLHPRGDLGARGFAGRGLEPMLRARPRHRTRHQHLRRSALTMEIAIGEAHAGHRAAETDFVYCDFHREGGASQML